MAKYKVKVRFKKKEDTGIISISGIAKELPRVGREFSVEIKRDTYNISVNFGQVIETIVEPGSIKALTEYMPIEVILLGTAGNGGEPRAKLIELFSDKTVKEKESQRPYLRLV